MYKSIQFTLSGEFAFFKKPDTNKDERLFTYSCIHKVALMGIIGAIIGLGGYNQRGKGEKQPEFYCKLNKLKVAIIPKNENSYIRKKIHTFNNSAGYASNENGNNLVTKEQWLEKPEWDIIIVTDSKFYSDNNIDIDFEILNEIEHYLLNNKSVYIPYLGKNEHPANILDVKKCNLNSITIKKDDCVLVSSIYKDDLFVPVELGRRNLMNKQVKHYRYSEFLPVSLEGAFGLYELDKLTHTNKNLKALKDTDAYKLDDKILLLI